VVGRIRTSIDIGGRLCWTLFDSGARNNYIVSSAIDGLTVFDLPQAKSAALGGREHTLTKASFVIAQVENHWVEFHANVIDEIGKDEDGRPIEVLFGALAMQEWGIRLDVPNERLDFSRYTRDFVEFSTPHS
jgi:hypothetical protein